MWEQLTPTDIQRARERLNRHAEEIKCLDLEQSEIEAFERLAESFASLASTSIAPPVL